MFVLVDMPLEMYFGVKTYACVSGWNLLASFANSSGLSLFGGYWAPRPIIERPNSPNVLLVAMV